MGNETTGKIQKWFDPQYKDRREGPLFSSISMLRDNQGDRLKYLEVYKMLYSEDQSKGYTMGISNLVNKLRADRTRFSENIIKSVIDTICAKIGKNTPKPMINTSGGDAQLRRKAQDLNKYIYGKFDELKVGPISRLILRDACVVGTGVGKILIDESTKNISIERIPVSTMFVDNNEVQYGKPRQMFQVISADKDTMAACYPKFAKKLQSAAEPDRSLFSYKKVDSTLTDHIELVEAWKLPDVVGNKGRHVICASNCTLVDEDYEDDEFPFVFIHYSEPLQGFWGEGLSKLLLEIQLRVNYLIINISENIRLCGKPMYLLEQNSNVAPGQLQNRIGNSLYYKGTKPELVNFQSTNPEVFRWLEDQRRRALELAGISQLSTQGEKPAGMTSGVALETYHDIETERFVLLGKSFEQFHMDVSEKMIKLTAKAYEDADEEERDQIFKAYYSRSWDVREINWGDVHMKRDEFNMEILPISSLPNDPAGRFQKIQEFIQSGFIDKDTGRELLDFPDMQAKTNLLDAAKDNAEKIVEEVYWDGKDHIVEKYHNIQYMKQYAQQMYNDQQRRGSSDTRLERLRQLMNQCDDRLEELAPAPEAPGTPPVAPGAGQTGPK